MDTSSGPKRNMRASITKQYEDRVKETMAKLDPNRAKARDALQDEDVILEPLDGDITAKERAPDPEVPYLEAPLMTLRELMPGGTGEDDEDGELDQQFRADKIEFLVMFRPLTTSEVKEKLILQDAADVDWTIPVHELYEDIMSQIFDIYTEVNPDMVHAFKWSSVGSATGVGCFCVKTGKPTDIEEIRGVLRSIIHEGLCFESFPKKALLKSFSLTAYFPRSTKFVGTKKLVYWLLACNPGLKGTIWPVEARKFPDTHPIPRKRGARILSFSGDQKFLDSLHNFPPNFPFSIKLANVYIRGGERAKNNNPQQRKRRPRMTEEALKKLLARHGKEITEEAERKEDENADGDT